jgi:hypothetical protein
MKLVVVPDADIRLKIAIACIENVFLQFPIEYQQPFFQGQCKNL